MHLLQLLQVLLCLRLLPLFMYSIIGRSPWHYNYYHYSQLLQNEHYYNYQYDKVIQLLTRPLLLIAVLSVAHVLLILMLLLPCSFLLN